MNTSILLFSAAVSLDLAAAAFALGSGGIKVPHLSAAIISAAGALFLVLPALPGDMIFGRLDGAVCRIAGRIILLLLGGAMIGKHFLKKRKKNSEVYPLCVCIDESKAGYADLNRDRKLSASESAVLGAGLSADSAVTGFSAGLTGLDRLECAAMFICTFLIGLAAVELCSAAGRKFAGRFNIQTEVVSGIILLILALIS